MLISFISVNNISYYYYYCYYYYYYYWQGRVNRGRERILSNLHTQHRAQYRAWSHDPEIMTWVEIKSQALNHLSHPGAPEPIFICTNTSIFKWGRSQQTFWACFSWLLIPLPLPAAVTSGPPGTELLPRLRDRPGPQCASLHFLAPVLYHPKSAVLTLPPSLPVK